MKSILLVEDHSVMLKILTTYLDMTRYRSANIQSAQSVDDAVAILQAHPIDAILMDNRIPPRFNFRETLTSIAATNWRGPIALMSGNRPPDLGEAEIDSLIQLFIDKDDLSPAALELLFDKLLGFGQDTPD